MPRSAKLNVVGVEPKGSKCNVKNLECIVKLPVVILAHYLELFGYGTSPLDNLSGTDRDT